MRIRTMFSHNPAFGRPRLLPGLPAGAARRLWTLAALARASGRRERLGADDIGWLEQTVTVVQRSLNSFYPTADGGWNMMVNQSDPQAHDVYTSTLALLALLELKQAS